jgi:hypothetical protein
LAGVKSGPESRVTDAEDLCEGGHDRRDVFGLLERWKRRSLRRLGRTLPIRQRRLDGYRRLDGDRRVGERELWWQDGIGGSSR